MTETRTTSSTGGQKGVKAQRYDLLPKQGLDAIAELFGYGATKYADHNWRNRYEFSKSIAALERHTQAFKDGETFDMCGQGCPDVDELNCREHSRLEHLAAVGFHTLVLLTWLRKDGEGLANEFDDRWPTTLERARLAKIQADEDARPRQTVAEVMLEHEIGIETALLTLFGGPPDDAPPTFDGRMDCQMAPVFDDWSAAEVQEKPPVFEIHLNSVPPQTARQVCVTLLHEEEVRRRRTQEMMHRAANGGGLIR